MLGQPAPRAPARTFIGLSGYAMRLLLHNKRIKQPDRPRGIVSEGLPGEGWFEEIEGVWVNAEVF